MPKKPDALSLAPDEEIKWVGNRAKRSIISSTGKGLKTVIGLIFLFLITSIAIAVESQYSFGGVCFAHFILLIVLILISPFIVEKKYQYAITNKRVFARKGIGTRSITEIPLEKVVNTTYEQGFIGRLLNFGNLQFNSAAGADQGVAFVGIRNVKNIDQKFKQIRTSKSIGQKQPQRNVQQTVNIQGSRSRSEQPAPPPPKPADAQVKEEPEKLESTDTDKKYCPDCGEEIMREANYCIGCGKRLT